MIIYFLFFLVLLILLLGRYSTFVWPSNTMSIRSCIPIILMACWKFSSLTVLAICPPPILLRFYSYFHLLYLQHLIMSYILRNRLSSLFYNLSLSIFIFICAIVFILFISVVSALVFSVYVSISQMLVLVLVVVFKTI